MANIDNFPRKVVINIERKNQYTVNTPHAPPLRHGKPHASMKVRQ